MESFDLSDSTDWLGTPLSLLTPLESALRCQVCKDFFDNPVITSCSHTFCSLCIRRCLSTEGKCPACRSGDQELKLRRNWAVQELVDAFQAARPSVLDLARKAVAAEGDDDGEGEGPVAKKRKVVARDEERLVADGAAAAASEGRQTRSRSRGVTTAPSEEVTMPVTEVIDDSQDEEFLPDDGMVACPCCSRRMKNDVVFQHLDICTGKSAPPKPVSFGPLKAQSSQSTTTKPPERLPTINYSLLKDNVLRKKLKDLGIPNWGPRALLQKRHTEYMNLWNANCDSKSPKSKRELLHELAVWERTQGGNATSADSGNAVMRKDFDATAWSTSHDTDFKQLIANARKRGDMMVRSTIPQAAAHSSESNGPAPLEQPVVSPIATGNEPGRANAPVDLTVADPVGEAQGPSNSQISNAPLG
ncbi:postreplication repair E3 ubiquitin-protein ligase rad18 [Aspergillus campestris IBT 28561]|uniref:Postreplication repair E3 ubiquitin-protein ligase RAD18 n=1 Tax=Aspergillus campestris (strain IBT 28561) TaxID=1392248 RepID=A0A2I1D6T5_ASPC2|nr:postreplication repair E3 ubiquitin-protein ligase rad18 [Aspergillus campestris IBT 28561]PKY05590.1 postreplication repair E3 ubiquitin-protein ligase rad18 [Aspergillus campestris IBT 28561]